MKKIREMKSVTKKWRPLEISFHEFFSLAFSKDQLKFVIMLWIFSKNEYNECNQKIGVKYAIYGKWVCDQNDPFTNFLKENKMMIWISNKAVNI